MSAEDKRSRKMKEEEKKGDLDLLNAALNVQRSAETWSRLNPLRVGQVAGVLLGGGTFDNALNQNHIGNFAVLPISSKVQIQMAEEGETQEMRERREEEEEEEEREGEGELRHRLRLPPRAAEADRSAATSESPSEDDHMPRDEDSAAEPLQGVPRGTDETVSALDSLLANLPPRWRNWVVRFIFTFLMIGGFVWLVRLGPIALMATVLAIQFKCFSEIIAIGLAVYRVYDLPWFRALSWYFLLSSNYFFYGESLIDYWGTLLRRDDFLHSLVHHHRFISFGLYCIGFVWFVLSLKKGYYMRQFSLFAWTHVTLLLIVTQSYLIIQNCFQGMIWLLVPVSMIICGDIFSYVFGFFFGKTPLIKLSPKKTWEGFIGGGASTIAFGLLLSYWLLHYPFFVCSLAEMAEGAAVEVGGGCVVSSSFRLVDVALPRPFSWLWRLVGAQPVLRLYPFLGHALVMALFAAILGPFGGFFASGFKRAFKIKDFGDVIPGHGGLMDRFDCQLLMGTFVNVYIHTFVRIPSPMKLVQQVLFLQPEQQLEVYKMLTTELEALGVLNSTIT